MTITTRHWWIAAIQFLFMTGSSFSVNAQQVASELPALQQAVQAEDKLPLGQRLFVARCAICHGTEPYHPATQLLKKTRGTDGRLFGREYMTEEYVKTIARNGMRGMFPFRKVDLSDEELDAIAKYVAAGAKK